MKRKGLSILLSVLLVMILTVSFSVPVFAADFTLTPFENKEASAVIYTNISSFNKSSGGSVQNLPSGSAYYDLDFSTFETIDFTAYVVFTLASPLDFRTLNYNAISVHFPVFVSPPPISFVSYTYNGTGDGGFVNTLRTTSDPFFAIGPYNTVYSIDDLRIVHGDTSTVISNLDHTKIYSLYAVYPVAGSYFGGSTLVFGKNNFHLKSTLNITVSINPVTSSDSSVTSGDIKSQTNTLTNGYDNSGLNQSNSNLSGAIADYDSTESQITDSSVANIDGAVFISPASNATLLTSISFCTSWLQSLFVNLGDWSLLVTVSLSLALGLMLIGWFKYR